MYTDDHHKIQNRKRLTEAEKLNLQQTKKNQFYLNIDILLTIKFNAPILIYEFYEFVVITHAHRHFRIKK